MNAPAAVISVDFNALARPEVSSLPLYNAGLSSEAVTARYGVTDIARLASNENPFGASPAVAQAMVNLAARISLYPDAHAVALRSAIAARTGTTPSRIVIGNGSEDILQMLCQALLRPGDRVLTQRPAFGLHEIYPRMMGSQVELLALNAELTFDVEAWCEALARAPKIAMIANPSNPVGCMFDAAAFERLLDSGDQTLLVIDEAYWEYACLAPNFPDTLTALKERRQPWIVLRTFSKAWGLAGLRVGYGIASDEVLVQLLNRVRTPFNANYAAQVAALAAWDDEAFMQESVAETVLQREVLAGGLRALGLRVAPSAANFLFVDVGKLSTPVHEALLARGIIVKAWSEPGFQNFLRISVGTPQSNARCLSALAELLS